MFGFFCYLVLLLCVGGHGHRKSFSCCGSERVSLMCSVFKCLDCCLLFGSVLNVGGHSHRILIFTALLNVCRLFVFLVL